MGTPTVPIPTWIDWDNKYHSVSKPVYYRKITNLNGGNDSKLKWLSEFNTNQSGINGDNDIVIGPIYDYDPKYLWFLDTSSAKLKVSKNSPESLALDPKASPCYSTKKGIGGCSNTNCCTAESTTEVGKCVYGWVRQGLGGQGEGKPGYRNLCGSGDVKPNTGNRWSGPGPTTCDHWSYISDQIIYDEKSNQPTQDISGTFCNNTMYQEAHMRTFLGCDCAADGLDYRCQNIGGDECNSQKSDDPKISELADSVNARKQWQFIDEENAFACCCQDKQTIDSGTYLQCSGAFDPTADGSKCSALTQQYCSNHWGDRTDIGKNCQAFLYNSPANCKTTQLSIQNYITSRSKFNQPQDYISYDLLKSNNELAIKYYTQDHLCAPSYEANDCSTNPNYYDPISNPCCRDDSRDPFFNHTIPYMCNFQYDPTHAPPKNSMGSCCDGQLQYFCQSFTREDLAADLTLQNMCGCQLITTRPAQPLPALNIFGQTDQMKLDRCGGEIDGICEVPSESPYYIDPKGAGPNCDVICNTAIVQSGTLGGPCKQPICMIDDVTINQINSNTGNNTITQNCDGSTCYIVGASFNEIGSQLGDTNIIQNCSQCYFTSGDDLITAEPYDCSTGKPLGSPPKKEKGDGNKIWSFFTKNISLLIILLIIIGVVICFFIASYYNRKYKKQIENIIPPEGIAFGNEYWESF